MAFSKKISGQNIDKMTEKSKTPEGIFSENISIKSSDLEDPFVKKFADIPFDGKLPNIDNDFQRAKSYLMKQCSDSGDNLYDHLNEVLNKILTERPRRIADVFEEYSRRVREEKVKLKSDNLHDVFVSPEYHENAKKIMSLVQSSDPPEDFGELNEDEEDEKEGPNMMELVHYFEQAGVGLPRSEIFCTCLAMQKLTKSEGVKTVRFWGKIFGRSKNYIVAETELTDDEYAKRNEEMEELETAAKELEREESERKAEQSREEKEKEMEEAVRREEEFASKRAELEGKLNEAGEHVGKPWPPIQPIPVPIVKDSPKCPREPSGVGGNKKVYYVCNDPSDEWIKLPDVTPQQIIAARFIKHFMVGDLNTEIKSYPEFPGNEGNLLRAQIARISASTQISPLGYFTFSQDEEQEEEEVEGGRTEFTKNVDYEPIAIRDLVDPTMSFWVHHSPYLLKQGRTTWWTPKSTDEDLGQEDEEDEGENEQGEDEAEKEVGPELLTPLSEDSSVNGVTPWTVRKTSSLLPEHCLAVVRSNVWPGAFAFADKKQFGNIYIGYGVKYTGQSHTPQPMGVLQEEYETGPEILEINDPTVEQEEEWRKLHEKIVEVMGEEEEEEDNEQKDDKSEDEDE